MKNIGMLVAVEIKAVLDKYGDFLEEITFPGFGVKKYTTEKYNLFIVNCGAGEIAAAAGTQFLITEFSADLIVNFGVVGGLTPEMAVAKTCIVESVVHYDFDTSASELDIEAGRYLTYPSVYIPASCELINAAMKLHPTLTKVICASGDKFISDKSKKEELHNKFGADICEMEAAGIVLTCNRNKIPCLLIKTVSDSIHGGAEEFKREIANSAAICLDILAKTIDSIH